MKFREVFEKYKSGTATDDEKKFIETEIDKYQALSDYVYKDDDDFDAFEGSKSSLEREQEFTRTVKKKTRRQFARMGSILFCILLVVIVFIQFGLSPLVSLFYYNPNQIIATSGSDRKDKHVEFSASRLETDMAVFTELTGPMELRVPFRITKQGYGSYGVVFRQEDMFSSNIPKAPDVYGEIKRDKLTLYDPSFLKPSQINATYSTETNVPIEEGMSEEESIFRSKWEELDGDLAKDDSNKVIITLKDYYAFEKAVRLKNKYIENNVWYAVKTASGEEDELSRDFGVSDDNRFLPVWDNQTYPNLINSVRYENHVEVINRDLLGIEYSESTKYMKTHLMSMLKYMVDNQTFSQMMEESIYGEDNDSKQAVSPYQQAYQYLEKNPLEVYGMVTYLDRQTVKQLLKEDMVKNVHLYDLENFD